MNLRDEAHPLAETSEFHAEARAVAAAPRGERERIGMELHGGVIQSWCALGLGLEATIQALDTDVPLARTRLIQARDTINDTIQEIRTDIVGLRAEGGPTATLATRSADHRERPPGVGHRGPASGMRMKGRPR